MHSTTIQNIITYRYSRRNMYYTNIIVLKRSSRAWNRFRNIKIPVNAIYLYKYIIILLIYNIKIEKDENSSKTHIAYRNNTYNIIIITMSPRLLHRRGWSRRLQFAWFSGFSSNVFFFIFIASRFFTLCHDAHISYKVHKTVASVMIIIYIRRYRGDVFYRPSAPECVFKWSTTRILYSRNLSCGTMVAVYMYRKRGT